MQFGTGSTTELTQKREGQSTKMPYVRPYIYTNKHPRFFHFYPCKCLARYARSPTSGALDANAWRASEYMSIGKDDL